MAARTLKIKTGTANRTRKELAAYISELDNEKAKLETMKAGGSDRSQIKQQENVVEETAMMVPDTCTRLQNAVADLAALLEGDAVEDLKGDCPDELKAAQTTLAECEAALA